MDFIKHFEIANLKPHKFFFGGLILLLLVVTLMYFNLPVHNYYDGHWVIYRPHKSLPESTTMAPVTNIYLLIRVSSYLIIYWLIFVSVYSVLSVTNSLDLNKRYALLHFSLTLVASVLMLSNNFIIDLASEPHFLDMITVGNLTDEQQIQLNQLSVFYDFLRSKPTMIGILLIALGTIAFILNVIKSFVARQKNAFKQ